MRFLFLLIGAITGIAAFSQQPFEGTITYRLHSGEKKEDGQLTILFGKNSVRLKMMEKGAVDKEELLIRIDSGKLYTLNIEEKTFRTKKLLEKKKDSVALAPKNIAGFTASPKDVSDHSAMGLIGGLFAGHKIVFYVADSLFYPVPDKYLSNAEFIFSHDNRIALGLEIKANPKTDDEEPREELGDLMGQADITVEAISVKRETINENEFTVPADFVKYAHSRQSFLDDSLVKAAADSVAAVDDSTARAMADSIAASSKKPAVKSSPKTRQPAKPGTRTSTNKNGAIRKQD